MCSTQVPRPMPPPHQRRSLGLLVLLQLVRIPLRPKLAALNDIIHELLQAPIPAQCLRVPHDLILRFARLRKVAERNHELATQQEESIEQARAPIEDLAAVVVNGLGESGLLRPADEVDGSAPGLGELDLVEAVAIKLAAARVLVCGGIRRLAETQLANEDERGGADGGLEVSNVRAVAWLVEGVGDEQCSGVVGEVFGGEDREGTHVHDDLAYEGSVGIRASADAGNR